MRLFGDGLGVAADPAVAARTAVDAALVNLRGELPDLGVVFAAGPLAATAAEAAMALLGARTAIGCTAEGVLSGTSAVAGSSAVSVWAASMPDVRLRTFHLEVLPTEGSLAVMGLPPAQPGDDIMLLLTDPYSFPLDGFLLQLSRVAPSLAVVGGLAHGRAGAGSTALLIDGRVVDRGAVGVVLVGSGGRAAVAQGCRPVGPEMAVTEVDGAKVLGLSLVPAQQRLHDVLVDLPPQEQALASRRLLLGVATEESAEDPQYLVRAVVDIDEASGALTMEYPLHVGQTVRLHVADAEAADAELRGLVSGGRRGSGALLFSSSLRDERLFGAAHGGAAHDAVVVSEMLRPDALAGMFTQGQAGQLGTRSWLHGGATSIVAFPPDAPGAV